MGRYSRPLMEHAATTRNNDESFHDKGRDNKNTAHKGKSKGSKSGKSGKRREGKCKSASKNSVKVKGDPLELCLVSRTQCRLCGEEGHWEEDCPRADVDMPQAKRRATFSRLPVVVGGVLKLGRSRRRQKVLKLDSKCGHLKKFKKARISWASP